MGPVLTKSHTGFFLAALFWVVIAWANPAISSATILVEDERDWLDQAARLVDIAQSGQAEAIQYNKDVRESRAQLRLHIQKTNNVDLPPAHRQLHSTLLVMDVLLKSAAACQTAGHIVCPPLLMRQLKTVLKNAFSKLDEIEGNSDKFKASVLQ